MKLLTHLLFIWITITCSLVPLQQIAATTLTHSGAPAVGLYGPNRYDGIPDDCLLPMEFGYCRAKVKRYYFDVRRMKCAMFFWGGCAGNSNNFKTVDECNQVCLDGYEDIAQSNNAQVGQQQQQQPQQQQQQRGNSNYNTNTRAGSTAAAPIAATSTSTGGINNSNSKYATGIADKGNFKSYLNKINNRSGDSINNTNNNNNNNNNTPNDSVYAASEDYDDEDEAETVE